MARTGGRNDQAVVVGLPQKDSLVFVRPGLDSCRETPLSLFDRVVVAGPGATADAVCKGGSCRIKLLLTMKSIDYS